MREIKFRAWDDLNHEYHFSDDPDDDRVAWIFENGAIGVYNVGEIEPGRNEVARELSGPIEQFTGLLDKNGKEIYESDILELNSGFFVGAIRYKTGRTAPEAINVGQWTLWRNSRDFLNGEQELFNLWVSEDVEIIGNIHTNPELLEK